MAGARAQAVRCGGSTTGAAPGAVLQLARPGGVLAEVLADGVDDKTSWELACLVNKVLMAEQVDLGELDQVQGSDGTGLCHPQPGPRTPGRQ